MATMVKLHELHLELLSQPPYSPDLTAKLHVCRSKKNAPEQNIWFQGRSDYQN